MCVCVYFQCIREILLLGHRQAFAWIDDWYSMTLEDVRSYESTMHDKTNCLVQQPGEAQATEVSELGTPTSRTPTSPNTPNTPKTPESAKKSMFSWF